MSQKRNLGAIVCLILGAWLSGCASRPAVRPSACECRDPVAQTSGEFARVLDGAIRLMEAQQAARNAVTRVEAQRAASDAVTRVEAQQAVDVVAHPEQSQREGEAAFKLGELQGHLERLAQP